MEDVLVLGIIGLVVALGLTILTLLWYSGTFLSVEVGTEKPPFANLKLAYKFVIGPFKDCGPVFSELQALAPDLKTCAIYYDDPKKVDNSKLRYMVAGVLAEGDEEVDKAKEKKLLENGFKYFETPRVDFVVHSAFPYVWEYSCYIAIMKVYPKLGEYINERQLSAHPAIEFYNPSAIHFVMPLSKQESFYVPEIAYSEGSEEESEPRPKSDKEADKVSKEKGNEPPKSPSSADKTEKKEDSGEESSSSFEKVDAPN